MTDRTAFLAAALRGHGAEAEKIAQGLSPVECEELAIQLQEAALLLIRSSGDRQ